MYDLLLGDVSRLVFKPKVCTSEVFNVLIYILKQDLSVTYNQYLVDSQFVVNHASTY